MDTLMTNPWTLAGAGAALSFLALALPALLKLQTLKSALRHGLERNKKDEQTIAELRSQLSRTEDSVRRAEEQLREATKHNENERRRLQQSAKDAGELEAVNLLGLLQQRGRLLDFLMDDITPYQDAQIGAAARIVHQGCAGVVREYFEVKPVHEGQEGGTLTLERDYDAGRYRLIGRVAGEPPYRGRITHRGWRTQSIKLPRRVLEQNPQNTGIIAPAEVELS